MVKLHVIYCYIISVMWYWTYMNLLDLSRVSWNWSILDPWRPPGITAVSAARSSRDSARRPLWIVVIHLWSRCWTMVDSFILNGEKRKKPWWFMVIHQIFHGKNMEKPWKFPSTRGDSWWFQSASAELRSAPGHGEAIQGQRLRGFSDRFKRLQHASTIWFCWRSCYLTWGSSVLGTTRDLVCVFFCGEGKCLQVGLFTLWVKMRVWNLHPSEKFCPLGFAENGEPPIP